MRQTFRQTAPTEFQNRFKSVWTIVKGLDLGPVVQVIVEERRCARQTSEGNLRHESSANSLFILRKICCRSSTCACFNGSNGFRGTPESKPSMLIPALSPAIPYLAVTAAAAGAMIRWTSPALR